MQCDRFVDLFESLQAIDKLALPNEITLRASSADCTEM